MRVKILHGYRGKLTHERYLPSGEHELKPGLANYLIKNGHALPLEVEAVGQLEATSLEDMTVAELRAYARDNDITLGTVTRKEEIIEVIRDA